MWNLILSRKKLLWFWIQLNWRQQGSKLERPNHIFICRFGSWRNRSCHEFCYSSPKLCLWKHSVYYVKICNIIWSLGRSQLYWISFQVCGEEQKPCEENRTVSMIYFLTPVYKCEWDKWTHESKKTPKCGTSEVFNVWFLWLWCFGVFNKQVRVGVEEKRGY